MMFCPTLASAQATVVNISGFQDFDFSGWSGNGSMSRSDRLCVIKTNRFGFNQPNRRYRIVARGNGPGGAFQVRAPGNAVMNYEVFFRGSAGQERAMRANRSRRFRRAARSRQECGGGNATLRIRLPEDELGQALSGNYRGVIFIRLEP